MRNQRKDGDLFLIVEKIIISEIADLFVVNGFAHLKSWIKMIRNVLMIVLLADGREIRSWLRR